MFGEVGKNAQIVQADLAKNRIESCEAYVPMPTGLSQIDITIVYTR